MIQEQAAAAVIIALISEKNSQEKTLAQKKKKLKSFMKLCLQNYRWNTNIINILLQMTSENCEKIFQLKKDDITKENT